MSLEPLKADFIRATKTILKAQISNNLTTLEGNRKDIVETYNKLIAYIGVNIGTANTADKAAYEKEIDYARSKLGECLVKFESNYTPSGNRLAIIVEAEIDINIGKKDEKTNMTLTTPDFMKICSAHLNRPYSGDPLSLTGFTDSVKLLNTLADSNELKEFLASFIKTKLEARAREIVATANTVKDILAALEAGIKPDNSKVIEGRMLSLRLSLPTQEDFIEKTEKLSDAFRRALISEGISQNKANEMTVTKTIELCRKNTHSDLIKAVLESTHFDTPKEVIAKLVTEVDKTKAERNILTYRAQPRHDNNIRGTYRGNNHSRPQNNQNKPQNGQNRNNQTNYRYNNNFRGRRNYNRNFNQNRPQNVHVATQQENGQAPQPRLGAADI